MNTQPESPNAILGRQLREVREGRRMTQQQLADKLGEMGVDPKPARATIARTELGERNVGLDETFALAAALDVSPSRLIVPARQGEARPVAIAPNLIVHPRIARQWLRGQVPLPGQDERTYFQDVSDEEYVALQDHTIRFLLMRVQDLLDAKERDDPDGEAAAVAAMNDELARMSAAIERSRP